ncbi:MAG: hypothetical protein SFW36_01220 [Leptolyngbyaceae cyanobacterium bins.59]|nr:hypothetical protein [Leptolyngbyaceae cyanobacterium bins.59]
MHCSIHRPSPFIQAHSAHLLPDWCLPVGSVLVVLQRCEVPLQETNDITETWKDELRGHFIHLALPIVMQLEAWNHLAEIFDPRTGLPLRSRCGPLPLDDVAVVRSVLRYPTLDCGGCEVVLHPCWQTAVYPSVVLSSAHPIVMEAVVTMAQLQFGQ